MDETRRQRLDALKYMESSTGKLSLSTEAGVAVDVAVDAADDAVYAAATPLDATGTV
jgi:hypothetical protein